MLPWDHITAGLHKDFLWQDWQAALAEHGLPDCRWTPCYDCGVCTDYALEHVVASPVPPAGGSQGTGQDLVAAQRRCRRQRRSGSWAPARSERSSRCAATPGSRSGSGTRSGERSAGSRTATSPGRWSGRSASPALPLAFSEGFSPRPKVSFGLALSTGHESDAEYLDLEFLHEVDCDDLPPVFSEALPDGMAVVAAAPLVERAPALQEAVTAVVWQVEVVRGDGTPATPAVLDAYVEAALAAPELPTERHKKGREVVEDVRPVIRRIDVDATRNRSGRHRYGTRHGVVHAAAEREAGRDPHGDRASQWRHRRTASRARTLRTHQWIERDGTRWEPQDADTRPRTPKAHAS